QSASDVRGLVLHFQSGCSPVMNLASTMVSVSGILILRALGSICGCMPGWFGGRLAPAKKAAYSQNCVRVHLAKGCLWHWAHSILTPKKTRAVAPARFS